LEIIRRVAEGITEKEGKVIVVDDSSSMIRIVIDELEEVIPLLMDSWERDERRNSLNPICWADFEKVIAERLGMVYNLG
jgi:hypothetical protein